MTGSAAGRVPPVPTPRRTYPLVQALRAAAALAVALHHVTHDAASLGASDATLATAIGVAMPWEAGVDIFFVISGFVMLHSSAALFQRGLRGIHIFAARRIARIVPLYWATTTAFLVVAAVDPHAIAASLGGVGYVLAAYAFIPAARPDGQMQPVFGLGWTLNYEMFFYLLFAASLWMPRRHALACLTVVLGGLVAAGMLVGFSNDILGFWSYQIVLEFVVGMWIRTVLPWIGPLPGWVRLVLVVLAVVAFRANFMASGIPRILSWGGPAACLVVAAVTGKHEPVSPWTTVWVRLGDASYALYLLHPFVIRAGSLVWRRFGLTTPAATLVYIGASLLLACLVALAVNHAAERPITRRVRRWLEPA